MMLWMLTALAAPQVDAIEPRLTRAGFPRFDHTAFNNEAGIDAVRGRLDRSTDAVERAALTDWLTRLTLLHGTVAQITALEQLALSSTHTEVRLGVAERMVRSEHAVGLLDLTSDPEPTVRAAALRLLEQAPEADRVRILTTAVDDIDPAVRVAAFRGVRAHKVQLPTQIEAHLLDSNAEVALQAALTLKTLYPARFDAHRAEMQGAADPRIQKLAR